MFVEISTLSLTPTVSLSFLRGTPLLSPSINLTGYHVEEGHQRVLDPTLGALL